MNENQKNYQAAKDAIILLIFVTMSITMVTFGTAMRKTSGKMNLFDFSLNAVDTIPYSMALILVLLCALPFCILLIKNNQISFRAICIDRKELSKDILYGCIGIVLSGIITLIMSPIQHMWSTIPNYPDEIMPLSTVLLRLVSLGIASGILKELYFRGMAMHIIGKVTGEDKALFVINILFGLLDWYNLGDSFLSGIIWCLLYKKRKRLIVPMIAHIGINVIGVLFYTL